MNYSSATASQQSGKPENSDVSATLDLTIMSPRDRAVFNKHAIGYEEPKLVRLLRTYRAHLQHHMLIVDPTAVATPERFTNVWLTKPTRAVDGSLTIGDGKYFPNIEIATSGDNNTDDYNEDLLLSTPLIQYNLNLVIRNRIPTPVLARVDRDTGECESVYTASLDEAVLVGHCVRLCNTNALYRNLDISACLTAFYRATHPCVDDLRVGDVVLDYEFDLYGKGSVNPIFSLLSHLASSCQIISIPEHKLFAITRHRGAAVCSRGTDSDTLCPITSRINLIGAVLCAQDYRLAPLLSRCCSSEPLTSRELQIGSVLPRGDEETLLLDAYAKTLGDVYEFEKMRQPGIVRTSLGVWNFVKLVRDNNISNREPGYTVIDGYTIAHAAESPLLYLRGHGALVQKLESVAVAVVDCTYRTDVMKNETPEWPEPDMIRRPIKCKQKERVLDHMFMRRGKRDPLDCYISPTTTWRCVASSEWMYIKSTQESYHEWSVIYPITGDRIGRNTSDISTDITWRFNKPPSGFGVRNRAPIRLDSELVRARDETDVWRGFDMLCSRVLCSKDEKLWTRGLCNVINAHLEQFDNVSTAPMSRLITIACAGHWCAQKQTVAVMQPYNNNIDEDEDYYGFFEVCTPCDFIHALAVVLLSGRVHEDVEIRCLQPGLFEYIQHALLWFAKATGPFRSRVIKVFTPECEQATDCRWTHDSIITSSNLDVLHTNSTDYLLSVDKQKPNREFDAFLSASKNIIRVNNAPGNVILHTTESVLASTQGVCAMASFPEKAALCINDDTNRVILMNKYSLKEYCRLREIPRGVRGPDMWSVLVPWSRKDPGQFCLTVTRLKFRWESGTEDWSNAPLCDADGGVGKQQRMRHTALWNRCVVDNKLISPSARFWDIIDTTASYDLSGGQHEPDSFDTVLDEPHNVITVPSRWQESSGRFASLILNNRLELRLVYDKPNIESHIFFETARSTNVSVCANGKVIRYYKKHAYKTLTRDVYTLLVYGCGTVPVFTYQIKDGLNMSRVIRLVFGTLAVSDRLIESRPTGKHTIVIYMKDGRTAATRFARNMVNTVVVSAASITGESNAYTFTRLPESLDNQPVVQQFQARTYANPTRFLQAVGSRLFTSAMDIYPPLKKRGDVYSPLTAQDPRWLGVVFCVAEWKRNRTLANELIPGCLESLTT